MLVQAGLCQTCSETTLLVFPRGGSFNTGTIVTILWPVSSDVHQWKQVQQMATKNAYGAMLEPLSISGHSSCSKFENNMISKITDWREILLWLMSHKVNKYYKQLNDLIVSDRHPTQMSSLKVISLSSRMPFEPQARQ